MGSHITFSRERETQSRRARGFAKLLHTNLTKTILFFFFFGRRTKTLVDTRV